MGQREDELARLMQRAMDIIGPDALADVSNRVLHAVLQDASSSDRPFSEPEARRRYEETLTAELRQIVRPQ